MKLIHLSDIHYVKNWEENQGEVLDSFFEDLSRQMEGEENDYYVIFSGDIVKDGADVDLYLEFLSVFDRNLKSVGLNIEKRICIPGNHDACRSFIQEHNVTHEGVIGLSLNEKKFNDYIAKTPSIFEGKFNKYIDFEKKFAKYTSLYSGIGGTGYDIHDNLSIYLLNTAICTSGGYENINDKGRLSINTRSLNRWLSQSDSSLKILAMHHPVDWLNEWSKHELQQIIEKHFSLTLYGHNHNQSLYHFMNEDASRVECSSPPLFTNKNEELGYSIINIGSEGVEDISYRQWTKRKKFVTGVNFSNTDNGVVKVSNSNNNIDHYVHTIIKDNFALDFDYSLKSFSSQPLIWVEPILSKTSGMSGAEIKNKDNVVELCEVINNPKSLLIQAPPQFGLTCLALYIRKQAWIKKSFFWLYLDVKQVKSLNRIEKHINKELFSTGNSSKNIQGIILDSWIRGEKGSVKIISKLKEMYPDLPIMIFQTIDEGSFLMGLNRSTFDFPIDTLYLLSLPRTAIRKVVSAYNDDREIGDEDRLVAKVTNDLDCLNIHRTPLNCVTLLKVSEKYFDESPVNRTNMLEMVLFLLFNLEEVPTYKARPDLKDCEFVLGCFCEQIIKGGKNSFSRDYFVNELHLFCKKLLMDIEVEVVFDVLLSNQIIIKCGGQYSFRFNYWIFFFAAQRMHHDKEFAEYILNNRKYASFPEIIEFYTGIDRRREDAINVLINDLKDTCDRVYEKVGISDGMNPLQYLQWNPTPEGIERMQKDISEKVLKSNLPSEVKDQHADRNYDQRSPYHQDIGNILERYSLVLLMKCTIACCRALRNSDYVNPLIKQNMLKQILVSWEQLSKVFFVITPILAIKNSAIFHGVRFTLDGHFGNSTEERITTILSQIPYNVVNNYHDDIYSEKMGPLIYDQLDKVSNPMIRHEVILLLIYKRPRKWNSVVADYIVFQPIDSFYLCDVIAKLSDQYKYSFASEEHLNKMRYLIKMGIAKHEFREKKPSIKDMIKINESPSGEED